MVWNNVFIIIIIIIIINEANYIQKLSSKKTIMYKYLQYLQRATCCNGGSISDNSNQMLQLRAQDGRGGVGVVGGGRRKRSPLPLNWRRAAANRNQRNNNKRNKTKHIKKQKKQINRTKKNKKPKPNLTKKTNSKIRIISPPLPHNFPIHFLFFSFDFFLSEFRISFGLNNSK